MTKNLMERLEAALRNAEDNHDDVKVNLIAQQIAKLEDRGFGLREMAADDAYAERRDTRR